MSSVGRRGAAPRWIIASLVFAACGGDDKPASEDDAAVVDGSEPDAQAPSEDSGTVDAGGDGQVADAASIACETVAPTECPSPMPTYADIEPILQQRCLSCHDGTQEQWPLTSYSHAADWHDLLRAAMLSCVMPPPTSGIEMPLAERQLLLDWLRCGYPE